MVMLRQIEHKIESLFEGIFGRAFRTHVQPVELARKLAKEMDDGKTVSVSRVYVPNEYSVFLSPNDREQFASYEDAVGELGIATRMVQARGGPEVPEREPSATMIYRPSQPPTEAASPEELGLGRELVTLNVNGRKFEIAKQRTVIGRSRDCDVQIE